MFDSNETNVFISLHLYIINTSMSKHTFNIAPHKYMNVCRLNGRTTYIHTRIYASFVSLLITLVLIPYRHLITWIAYMLVDFVPTYIHEYKHQQVCKYYFNSKHFTCKLYTYTAASYSNMNTDRITLLSSGSCKSTWGNIQSKIIKS